MHAFDQHRPAPDALSQTPYPEEDAGLTQVLHLRIERRNELEALLDGAVDQLIESGALLGDRGIRITRHSAHDFTVKLDPSVPYGICHEEQAW